MSVSTVFLGSDSFSVPTLSALFVQGRALNPSLEVVGVVTQPDRRAGRGRRSSMNPVKTLASAYGVPVLQPDRLRAPAAWQSIASLDPQLIVVASYGQIVPQSILDLPMHRCLNIHPSLLPLYRGPSPVVGPLLNGDAETGVSLMLMTADMDAGPLVSQERTAIGTMETAGELESRLARVGAALLLDRVSPWTAGQLQPHPQDDSRATYTTKVTKDEGNVDWNLTADEIARRVRAFNPWPMAFTFWRDRQVRILRARADMGRARPGAVRISGRRELRVGTGDGLLLVEELQLAGRKPLDVEQFLRGLPGIEGAQLSREPAWSSE